MFNLKAKRSFERRRSRVRFNVRLNKKYPRLSVHRTNKNIYVQLIDDINNCTLASASTLEPLFKKELLPGSNIAAAEWVGKLIAERSLVLGIKQVVFDRGGYLYHGRVKALANSARKNSLTF
jgi:large subunit ribosomal protein L18